MNLNETKKIVDFMKENGISELEYAAKGTTIKLKLNAKELKKGKKSNEETFAPILDEIEEEVEEVGVREVTAYTAEPDPTEEQAEELETEVEKPSAAVRAIVAVGGARRKAVSAVSGLFKRRAAAAPAVETADAVEDDEDEVATEVDVMKDHEEAAKAANTSLRSRNPFARFIKSQKDGAAHAKAMLEDEEEDIQNAEDAEDVTEEAPAEEVAEKSGRLGGLLNRFRRKKGEDVAAEETEPVVESVEDVAVEEPAVDVTEEEASAEEPVEAAVEEAEPVVESVEDVAEAVEEPVKAEEDAEPVVESVEDVAEAVEEPAEVVEAEPVVESVEDVAEDDAEEPVEEERSEEDKLFDIVG